MIAIFHNSTSDNSTVHYPTVTIGPLTDQWEIPMECLVFDQLLGEGCFGEVFLGSIIDDQFNGTLIRQQTTLMGEGRGFVAIKLLKCMYYHVYI